MQFESSPPSVIARGPMYQGYFEMVFAAADITAMWWQPLLKGIGRTHLELSAMQSRNAQAALAWTRDVGAARGVGDLQAANVRFYETVSGHIGDAIPRVSGALTQAAVPPPAFELVEMPVRQRRDTLMLLDGDDLRERRVA